MLAIAGVTCVILAIGHAVVGRRWVFASLRKELLPATAFGPPSLTLGMLRFTWNVVTVLLVSFAALLMLLAAFPDADPRALLLRWTAAFWLAATAMACWQARRRPSDIIRFPVPVLMSVIAALCWTASF